MLPSTGPKSGGTKFVGIGEDLNPLKEFKINLNDKVFFKLGDVKFKGKVINSTHVAGITPPVPDAITYNLMVNNINKYI